MVAERSRGIDLLLTFLISLVTSAAVLFLLGPVMLRSQGVVPGVSGSAPAEPVAPVTAPPPAAHPPMTPPAPTMTAPNLEGLDVEAARARVRKSGIAVIEDGERRDASAKPGEIVEQNPSPGSALEQPEIRVIVATEAAQVEVPDVTGQLEEDARKTLEDAGFEVPPPDSAVPKEGEKAGAVISQDPAAGKQAADGSLVRLTVAKATVAVPRVLHTSMTSARKKIEAAGLEVGEITMREHEEMSGRKVLSQDPDPGTRVSPGSKVDLVIVAPD